jgi:hypothetical protein
MSQERHAGCEQLDGASDVGCILKLGLDEARSTDTARLVFWEAKHFSNPELRAAGEKWAPVCYQVEGYQNYLSDNRDAIVESYKKVVENLMAIRRMRWKRSLSPLIDEVNTRKRQLTLGERDEKPKVGLIIFGFDMGQRDHPIWQDHLKTLKANIADVRAAGDAKVIKIWPEAHGSSRHTADRR